MPTHWSSPRLQIVSSSSCCTTQCLHAVGAAEAGNLRQRVPGLETAVDGTDDEVVLVAMGDGQTSGGEFWESLNTACLRNLPIIYLVEDNGYAISVPVEVNTAGRLDQLGTGRVGFPGLYIQRSGRLRLRRFSYEAMMRKAVQHCVRERKGPAFVHAQGDPSVLALALGRRA